mgnify:CR=1 FL=1
MALSTKIKSSFTKFKKSSTKNKVLVAVFVVGFAAAGVFGVVNSGASPSGAYANFTIHFDALAEDGFTHSGVSGIVVTMNSNNSSYFCTGQNNTRGNSVKFTTDGAGNAYFTSCNSNYTTYKQYTWSYTVPTGYINNGTVQGTTISRTVTLIPGQQSSATELLSKHTYNVCPQEKPGVYPNCGTVVAPNVSFPTDLTVRYNPIDYGSSTSMYWNSINGTACSLERATVTNGAIGTFGNGISTPIGLQERNPGTLTTTTAFRVYCSGINGGAPGYSSARIVTVNPQVFATGDTTPPSAPTGVVGTAIGGGKITLNWNGSTDNVGVTQYKVKLAGWGTVATVNAPLHTVTLNSATPGSSYSYTVVAVDAAGNQSAASNSVTVIAK